MRLTYLMLNIPIMFKKNNKLIKNKISNNIIFLNNINGHQNCNFIINKK